MKEAILYAPKWYWELPTEEQEKGRCGPGQGWLEAIIPDTVWGLSIRPACQIHDKMYQRGSTISDKESADRIFLNNMLRLIDANSNWFTRWLRRKRAFAYYESVSDFGGPAFWKNKNKPEELALIGGV